MSVARVLSRAGGEETIGDFLTSYAKKGESDNLMEQAVRIDNLNTKMNDAITALESGGGLGEREILGNALRDLDPTSRLIKEAEDTGSVVGLLRRQEQIREAAGGSVNQVKGFTDRFEYNRLSNKIDEMDRASYLGPGGYGPISKSRSQAAHSRLYSEDLYDEAVHMRNNTATSTNAMNGGTSGPTSPSSSNMPINPETVPGGYSGLYEPSRGVAPGGTSLDLMESNSSLGLASSILGGAAVGGVANYAMGGDFSEGAMMGGLAGGAIKIGATAIQQNQVGIERFLQRTALGDPGQGMSRAQAAEAIRDMSAAPEGAGLMQRGAFGLLKSEAPSLGMQSRYMVMSGSALSGVAFTGRRNDKRRGFNSHRGNRI